MAGVTHWSGWRIVSALAFVAVCGILVFSATTRGAWDWDVIGYTMAVLKDGTPDVALHAKTWALVKQWVPAEALADLIYRDSYRQTMHATPAALISQLPLYESKLGYVLLLKALSPVADPIGAMRAVSLVCTLGILRSCFANAGRSAGWLRWHGCPSSACSACPSSRPCYRPIPSPPSSMSWPLPRCWPAGSSWRWASPSSPSSSGPKAPC